MQRLQQTLIGTGYNYFQLHDDRLEGTYRGTDIWISENGGTYTIRYFRDPGMRPVVSTTVIEAGVNRILWDTERDIDKEIYNKDMTIVLSLTGIVCVLAYVFWW